MQNEAGRNVDLYIPRKCSWTNRVISAKDHASVQIADGMVMVRRLQINVGVVDPETGKYTHENKAYALAGYIRGKGEADAALTELVRRDDQV